MEEFVAEWILDDIAHKFDSKQFRVTKGASKILYLFSMFQKLEFINLDTPRRSTCNFLS